MVYMSSRSSDSTPAFRYSLQRRNGWASGLVGAVAGGQVEGRGGEA